MESLWEAVDTNWAEILGAFAAHQELQMFDDKGVLIDSNRPMVESMVDDKIHRRGSFWYYMEMLMHDTSITRDGNNIYVTCGSPLILGDGGAVEEIEHDIS